MDEINPYALPPAGAESGPRREPDSATFRFAGQLSVGDFYRGYYLKYGPVAAVVRLVLLLVGCGLIFAAVWDVENGGVYVVALPVIIGGIYIFYLGRILTHRFRGTGVFQWHETRLAMDGVQQQTESAKVELKWDFFRRQRSSNRVAVLLLKNSRSYLILSRALLERDEDWRRVRQLLDRCLPS